MTESTIPKNRPAFRLDAAPINMEHAMQIVELKWNEPQRLYSGYAQSTRGRRYYWGANAAGKLCWVDRKELPPWSHLWRCLRDRPIALRQAVRAVIRLKVAS